VAERIRHPVPGTTGLELRRFKEADSVEFHRL
jgi:hypothetical protein